MLTKLLLSFLFAFFVGICFAPLLLKILKQAKAKQTILHYVEAHKQKNGTPTLGGLIFLFATTVSFLIFKTENSSLATISLLIFLSYGILGFLDDFIKIKTHKNLGLKAYQKIVGQAGISILVAVYVYKNSLLKSAIFLPWGMTEIDIGIWIIPLVIITFLAVTNSANLTDGLDGLAGSVSFVCLIALGVVTFLCGQHFENAGQALIFGEQMQNLTLLCVCISGGVLAFLCFNFFPAKIFMGDTGSLALGGVICSVATFCGQQLLLILICFVFVLSALSVIIQVVHFKFTKRRVFLMAPLHHHFEKKGMHETKIVAIYIVVSFVSSTLAILLCLI